MPTLSSELQSQVVDYGIFRAIEFMNADIRKLATFYESPMFEIAKKQADMAQLISKSMTNVFFPKHLFDSLAELPRTLNLAMGLLPRPLVDPPTHISTVLPLPTVQLTEEVSYKPTIIIATKKDVKTTITGLSTIEGGSFKYKRRILKGICMKNQSGRLLSLFVNSHNHFASDSDIKATLPTQDSFYLGQAVHRLKQAFWKNGYEVIIERRGDPDGYILIEITSCTKRG